MSDVRHIAIRRTALGSRVGRSAITLLMAVTALVLAAPVGASAEKPAYTCPPGFDLGGLTVDEALRLPNVMRALAAGVYDEAAARMGHDSLDKNNDGWSASSPIRRTRLSARASVLLQHR